MPDTRTFRVVDEDGDYEEFTGNPLDALNAAYRERAHLVALLAAVYPSRWGYDPNATQWRIVYVDLPTGQASWHISPDDVALFPHVTGDGGDQEWDGHTTAAKYERIDQLTALLAQAAEPDEEQLGQMAVPRFEIEHQAQAERDADVRAVAALLHAFDTDAHPVRIAAARKFLHARFADRIAALEAVALRTPEQWCAHYDVDIVDPDGWRRADDPPWDEPITLPDFWNRAARSTLRNAVGENWQRVARDARAALSARTTDGGTT